MNAGVYCIENIKNGKVYVGQSRDLAKRFRAHRRQLRDGDHYNFHLQSAYNLYGKDCFRFKILDKADDLGELNALEDKWIAHYKSFAEKNGYNIRFSNSVFRELRPALGRPPARGFCVVCSAPIMHDPEADPCCSRACRIADKHRRRLDMAEKATDEPTRKPVKKTCRHCSNIFVPTRRWQEFCKPSCRNKYWGIVKIDKDEGAAMRKMIKRIERAWRALNINKES